ncbi:MAG: HAD family hydrolase [Melioribacteraceae bacterium]
MNGKLLADFKGVFFDLYGTLLVFNDAQQSNADWVNSYYKFILKHKDISLSEVSNICADILESDIEKDKTLGLTTYETKINLWLKKLGITISGDELTAFADETVNLWQNNITLAADAGFVLKEIQKNKTLALITNFDHLPHIHRVVEKHQLDKYLNPILVSDAVEIKKPNPEIFSIALAQTGLKNGEVVFVGDSKDDIYGAIAAGIKPILIKHNGGNQTDTPKEFENITTIYSLSQLLE